MFAVHLKPYLTGKWVICHLLPGNETVMGSSAIGYNAQIAYINANIQTAMAGCAAQIEYVPVRPEYTDANGNLKAIYHNGDGQHPSKLLTECLAADIHQPLVNLGVQ